MDTKKIIVIVLIIALLAGGYYYWDKNKKSVKAEEEPVKADKKKVVTDPTSSVEPPKPTSTTATTPPPIPSPNMFGVTLKSRGKNRFDLYTIGDITSDVRQSDGTYKRVTTRGFVKEKGIVQRKKFKDGEVIGPVQQSTTGGFFIGLGDGKYIWANKDLLIK